MTDAADGVRGSLPRLALFDDPLDLRISGLPAGEQARVRAAAVLHNGQRWLSSAVYTVGPDGVLDSAATPSVGGSYEGLNDHGLLWSLRPEKDEPYASPPWFKLVIDVECGSIHMALEQTRAARLSGVSSTELTGPIYGTFFRPATGDCLPPIVVLGGSSGPAVHRAACLASHGFASLALTLFGDKLKGLPSKPLGMPVEYVVRAIEWIKSQPDVLHERVGMLAVSAGVPGALLAARYSEAVSAVALLSGPTVLLRVRGIGSAHSAWSLNGKRLPGFKPRGLVRALLTNSVEASQAAVIRASIGRATDFGEASLRLEEISSPILLAAGDADELVPVEASLAGLASRGERPDDLVLRYEGAGHIDRLPGLPSYPHVFKRAGIAVTSHGGATVANAVAIRDSWRNVVSFLRQHVGAALEVPRE